jgi:hypothetical protein
MRAKGMTYDTGFVRPGGVSAETPCEKFHRSGRLHAGVSGWWRPGSPGHFAAPQRASKGMRAWASGIPQPVTGSQPGPAW